MKVIYTIVQITDRWNYNSEENKYFTFNLQRFNYTLYKYHRFGLVDSRCMSRVLCIYPMNFAHFFPSQGYLPEYFFFPLLSCGICQNIFEGPSWSWSYGSWIYNYLQVQSVPITIKVVSSNPVHGEVYSIQQYVIKFDRAVTCD